jgi:hypothetical protein
MINISMISSILVLLRAGTFMNLDRGMLLLIRC